MAFATTMWCPVCKRERNIIISSGKPRPVMCASCKAKNENRKRQEYLENLKKENLYDRLEKVEEWIYDNKPVTDIIKNIPEVY